MSVGFQVGRIIDEIGDQEFLHAFFSTISYHLEPNGWGSRFPELMNDLYQCQLSPSHAQNVLEDVKVIREELKRFTPDKVIWDIENLNALPPWGDQISHEITNLSNYFITSTGRDLFDVLIECLNDSFHSKEELTIVQV